MMWCIKLRVSTTLFRGAPTLNLGSAGATTYKCKNTPHVINQLTHPPLRFVLTLPLTLLCSIVYTIGYIVWISYNFFLACKEELFVFQVPKI
jgi:hypothetical protein